MEKYKGFILQSDSSTSEDKYFDGHRNEGAGTYSTSYFVRIVDPASLKAMIVNDMKEAKRIIDTWYSKEGKRNAKALISAYKKKEHRLKKLEKETENKIRALEAKVAEAERELDKLYRGLPPKFT